MKIHFYATLRRIVGAKTVELALPEGATVRQLLEAAIAQYPELRPALLDAQGNLHRYVHLFINGRDARYFEKGLETPLNPSDQIDIFPPVAGG